MVLALWQRTLKNYALSVNFVKVREKGTKRNLLSTYLFNVSHQAKQGYDNLFSL